MLLFSVVTRYQYNQDVGEIIIGVALWSINQPLEPPKILRYDAFSYKLI